jgi:predicted NBD/HSP70 family sugar kinase
MKPAHAAALRAAAEAVAHALSAVITSVNSSVVVLGGRVASLPGFRDHVGSALRDQVPSWCAAELSVRASADDRAAGARGALVRARQRTESGPDQLLRAGNSRTAG